MPQLAQIKLHKTTLAADQNALVIPVGSAEEGINSSFTPIVSWLEGVLFWDRGKVAPSGNSYFIAKGGFAQETASFSIPPATRGGRWL